MSGRFSRTAAVGNLLDSETTFETQKNKIVLISIHVPHRHIPRFYQAAADVLGVLELDVPLNLLRGSRVADGPREPPPAHVHGPEEDKPRARRGHEKGHRVQRQEQDQEGHVPAAGED